MSGRLRHCLLNMLVSFLPKYVMFSHSSPPAVRSTLSYPGSSSVVQGPRIYVTIGATIWMQELCYQKRHYFTHGQQMHPFHFKSVADTTFIRLRIMNCHS